MTVNELAQQMITEHSERQGDDDYITMLERWIIGGLKEIGNKTNFKFYEKTYSFNTTVGTIPANAVYQLPNDVKQPKYLRITTLDMRIEFKDPAELVDRGEDLERVSRPQYWWYEGSGIVSSTFVKKIRLHPIPDAIYPIEMPYYYKLTGLSSSSQIPLPDEWEEVLKAYVRAKMLRVDKDYDGAGLERNEYTIGVAEMIRVSNTEAAKIRVLDITDLPKSTSRRKYARLPWN